MTPLVESALYGEDSQIRDEARTQLIRSGSANEISEVVSGLFATLDLHRRRATRLLSDLQPHRARVAIIEHLEELSSRGWACPPLISDKVFSEGLVHAARLLNQMTIRGEREEGLCLVYDSCKPKAQRATICPASPSRLLVFVLSNDSSPLHEMALTEVLRRLSALSEEGKSDRSLLMAQLKEEITPQRVKLRCEEYRAIDQSTAHFEMTQTVIRLWVKLFAHLYPSDPDATLWCSASFLSSLGLLTLITDPALLVTLLITSLNEDQPLGASSVSILLTLEGLQRKRGIEVSQLFDDDLVLRLSSHRQAVIRATLARLLPQGHPVLESLALDSEPAVSWAASEALTGRFSAEKVHSRLGAHPRLNSPSARPPYGLRDFDSIPTVPRVRAALALCQARFDVNLGVAMRSAEAAGFSQIFVIGARSGSLTSARGAEHAIPIRWLSDATELISIAREEGYQLVAVQQTPDSEPYHRASYPPQPLFILGSEDAGLPDELRVGADLAVEIPLYGVIDSLNVATAATCVMMHWRAHLED